MIQTARHIMLVDDDDIYRYITAKIILAIYPPAKIIHCQNGEEALSYLRAVMPKKQPLPDLVFLDLNMPVMGGLKFLEAFDAIKHGFDKTIPLYVVSSSADQVDKSAAAKHASVSGYLVKPVGKTAFNKILLSTLKGE